MSYWLRWTLVSGAGLFLGLSAAALLAVVGFGLTLSMTSLDTPTDWILALLAMIPAGFAVGAIAGWAQCSQLTKKFPSVGTARWIWLSVAASTIVLWLGSLLALPIGQISPRHYSTGFSAATIARLSTPEVLAVGGALGLAFGLVFGGLQLVELRRSMHGIGWIWANMLAWGLAMTVIFALTSEATIYWPAAALASIALGSLIIGAVNGIVVVRGKPREQYA